MKPILFIIFLLSSCQLFAADYVILISVDGLRPDAINLLGKENLPNFYRYREEGVWTDNARTDVDYTYTLPNHSSMITGRGVVGLEGHGQTSNGVPLGHRTLHNNTQRQVYISSIFDVAHDRGLSTAFYVSKTKFILFEQTYSQAGSSDKVGEDNGTNKIDRYVFLQENRKASVLVDKFLADMSENPTHLSFLHLRDPDSAGHDNNWMTPSYLDAIKRVNGYLGRLFDLVESSDELKGKTAIILTADHGGTGGSHISSSDPLNYSIPFYAWGKGAANEIPMGQDLYQLNKTVRMNPGTANPSYTNSHQPIRNGDIANLSMSLLGLPKIPGSTINASQDLVVELIQD